MCKKKATINSLHSAIEFLGGKAHRKLANNTYVVAVAEKFGDKMLCAVRLHQTDVVTFGPDRVTVYTGGWRTVTTKDRINSSLPDGFGIRQEGGVWKWCRDWSQEADFSEGDYIDLRDDSVRRVDGEVVIATDKVVAS